VRHIVRPPSALSILLASALGFAGLAVAAQPAAADPPSRPQPVATSECTPVTADGYQLCSSDKGTLELVRTPGGAPFYRLGLTTVRDLRHNGALAYRTDEQHSEVDLTKKPGGSATQEFVRAGAVIVGNGVTCTFDESSTVTNDQLRRALANLSCASGTTASAANPAARAAAAAPAALPNYADYSAVDTAPNGVPTPIHYGTPGQGNPSTTGCTVTTTTNPQTAVNSASAGAVICVKPGDYSTSTLTVTKAVTVRANGVVRLKNIVISGANAVVDGFNARPFQDRLRCR
jgi:hypothetical protein